MTFLKVGLLKGGEPSKIEARKALKQKPSMHTLKGLMTSSGKLTGGLPEYDRALTHATRTPWRKLFFPFNTDLFWVKPFA
jgi:hypothetical protein